MAGFVLGVDIGGTFTDFVLFDPATGRGFAGKTLTTPDDPARAFLEGARALLRQHEIANDDVAALAHATTLVTNAIIERKGAPTGLITTRGFRDVLQIARELRYDLYDLHLKVPEPIVPRPLRVEVPERLDRYGQEVEPLDEAALEQAAAQLDERGARAVAVVFLHAYANPTHERRAGEILRTARPDWSVSLSSEVSPEIREYERTSTTTLNAYVQPLVEHYLSRLTTGLAEAGLTSDLNIMLSSGGITTVEEAAAFPVRLIESGPAAGAFVAAYYADLIGVPDVISFDMGGTTAKICLIDGGRASVAWGFETARVHRFKKGSGLPVNIPAVELIEIGAGGGSIARADQLGLLKVGPDSSGADPGPACYDRGGNEPTVTDADLLLGYLDPEYFLGGGLALDREAALAAVRERLAGPLGLDPLKAAWGIAQVVNENMASAARIHIAERGHDPRRYALVAFGGAGPLHAEAVARRLGLKSVICPLAAGVASAFGLLVAPKRADRVAGYIGRLDALDWRYVNALLASLAEDGRQILRQAGLPDDRMLIERTADLRYVGQGYEVAVPLPDSQLGPESLPAIEESFLRVYEQLYGRALPGGRLEALNWRIAAIERSDPRRPLDLATGTTARDTALKGYRPAIWDDSAEPRDTAVYDRYALRPGDCHPGPAIVQERESTVVIGPGSTFRIDDHLNLIIELEGAS